ncbi:MAG: peptidoglycan-binding protein [Proteobacteria bacterium]|nr:peptidoglycan-binding protein [Pseudomonadota bacterium]
MKDGLLPVVAATGGIAAVLLWSVSAQDPYWRLFDTPSVPAPAYEAPEDLAAVLASVTLGFANNDAGAMSPATDPLAGAGRAIAALDIPPGIVRAAEAVAIPEPMLALVPPLEPEPMTGPATERMIAYRLPPAAIAGPGGFGPETFEPETFAPEILAAGRFETGAGLIVAFAPTPVAVPAALRGPGAGGVAPAVSGTALDPFLAPAPPAPPRVAASELTEQALGLERAGRIDVQRRLALAGFNPNGFDGAFGPRTRGAIADFQTAWGFPATGYLEAGVHADLNQRTEDAYQALRRRAAAAPSAAPELAPIALERRLASAEDDDRCARRSDGRIIERQSLACDLAGFGEQFISLGRNILNDEDGGADGGAVEIAAYTPPVFAPDADR